MNALLLSSLLWLAPQVGFTPTTIQSINPPVIIMEEDSTMDEYTGHAVAGYYVLTGTNRGNIYLRKSIDLTTIRGQSYLIHELVHFFQDTYPFEPPALCVASNEATAYRIQQLYLKEHNLDLSLPPIAIKILSYCPPRNYYDKYN